MPKRQVTVVINGEEYVSKAAQSAGDSLGGFAGKIPAWTKSLAFLTAAFAAVSAAVVRAKDYVLDAIASYDRYAASQTKLSAQSKLTGVSLEELNRIAERGRDAFGLSSVTANDAATTVAKYASRAGDATQANLLLARALDLGAASGLDAAATMEALEQGLRGQDEGFDKLLGKNPSSIWKEFADVNGLAVGKMTDTQKRLAELTAIVEAGGIVQGAYNDRMESGVGAQDRLNNKIDEAKVAFGQALQPLRVFVVQGLTTLVEQGGRVVLAIARVANAIGVVFTGAVEAARSGVGFLAVGIGKLTGSKDLENWGRDQSTAFSDFRAQLAKLEEKYLTTGKAATESETRQVAAAKNVTTAVKAAAESTEQQADRLNKALDAKLGRPMMVAIGLTEGAIQRLSESAREQLPAETAEKFSGHMKTLTERAEDARQRMLGIKDNAAAGRDNTRDAAANIKGMAEQALKAAEQFGVVDDHASRSLQSAITIGDTFGKMIRDGFTFGGVAGILGGVASIVGTMMNGDSERRQLQRESNERLRDNTARLKELTKEVGLLTLDVSGGEVAAIESLLEDIVPRLARGGDVFGGPNSFAAIVNGATSSLLSQGLGWDSIVALAKKFGINILDRDGAIDFAQLPVLLQALRSTNTAAPSQSFDSQLDIMRQGFAVNQTGDLSQIGQIMGLAEKFSPALRGVFRGNNIAGTRADLQRLFNDLAEGRLTEAQLGGLTGSQFLSLLTDIIGRIDRLPSGGESVSVGGAGGSLLAPGSSPVPVDTVQSVIKAMDSNLGTILTAHTAIHERIAAATEGSYAELRTLNGKVDELIVVTAGQIEATDAKLEAMRRMAALERGQRPAFG